MDKQTTASRATPSPSLFRKLKRGASSLRRKPTGTWNLRGSLEESARKLYEAVAERDLDACQRCLEEGADPLQPIKDSINFEIFSDITSLQAAVSYDNADALRAMLESINKKHGVPLNVNAVDLRIGGLPLLHTSVLKGFADNAKILLEAGADPWEEHPKFGSACKMARFGGKLEIMEMLYPYIKETTESQESDEVRELCTEIERLRSTEPMEQGVLKLSETTTQEIVRPAADAAMQKHLEELDKKFEKKFEQLEEKSSKKIKKLERQVKALKSRCKSIENLDCRSSTMKAVVTTSDSAVTYQINNLTINNHDSVNTASEKD